MKIRNIISNIYGQVTTSELSRVIQDKMFNSRDLMSSWISLTQIACFSDNRESDEIQYDESNDLYYFDMTLEEITQASDIFSNDIQDDVYLSFTLSDGNVIQMHPDKNAGIIYVVDKDNTEIPFINTNNGIALATLPTSSNDDRITIQSFLSDLVNSYDINEVIGTAVEALNSNVNSIADFKSYIDNKVPNIGNNAQKLRNEIFDCFSNYGPIGVLSYLQNMYKHLSLTTIDSTNQYIEFDSTIYTVKEWNVGMVVSTVAMSIGTLVGAIISIAYPIVGIVIAGVGALVSKAVEYYEKNIDPTYAKINEQSDNRSYAVPMDQFKVAQSDAPLLYDICNDTGKVVEFKTPGAIYNSWLDPRNDLVSVESRLDCGWKMSPYDYGIASWTTIVRGDETRRVIIINADTFNNWSNEIQMAFNDSEVYNIQIDASYKEDTKLMKNIDNAMQWYYLNILVSFVRAAAIDNEILLPSAPNHDIIIDLYDNDEPFITGTNAGFFEMAFKIRGSTWPGDAYTWQNYGSLSIHGTRILRDYTDWNGNYIPITVIDQVGGSRTSLFTKNMFQSYNNDSAWMSLTLGYTEFNPDGYSEYYNVNYDTGEATFLLMGSSCNNKTLSYLTPPSYDRQSLVLAALITGTILAVVTISVTIVAVATKRMIRDKSIKGYAQVELNRDALKEAMKTGDPTAIQTANKNYVKSVKRYNLFQKIFGGTSLNFVDGWQSAESSDSQLVKLTSTFDSIGINDPAFTNEDLNSSSFGNFNCADIVRLIK